MRSRAARLALSAGLVPIIALGLGACGDDEPGKPAVTESAAAPTDATPTAEPSVTAEPAIEPATGPQIESNALRMRVFADPDWYVRSLGSLMGATLDTDYGLFEVRISGIRTSATDLDRGAEIAEENESIERTAPTRVENRVINGVELYVLEGQAEGYRSIVLGGYHNGFQVNIDFDFHDDWPDADAQVESILASVEWK